MNLILMWIRYIANKIRHQGIIETIKEILREVSYSIRSH